MVMEIFLLLAGFVILIAGADFLVKGASSLAIHWGVSSLVIGLTVVSVGTSAPELFVSLTSSLQGAGGLLLGNILGSNIANVLLILGSAALVYPLAIKRHTVWREIPFTLFLTVLIAIIATSFTSSQGEISWRGGVILLLLFFLFLYYVFSITKSPRDIGLEKIREYQWPHSVFMLILGIAGLTFGAKLVVDSALALAGLFKISQSLVGLTLVAVGTSLPELATSLVAAFKRDNDIAVGNVIGSNIFNISLILGLSAIIRPVEFSPLLLFDLYVCAGVLVLLFLFMFIGKRHVLNRWQGAFFVALYFAYLFFSFYKG